MSNRVAASRRALRHQILSTFPGVPLKVIFAQVKAAGESQITFPDLEPYCASINVPVKTLPAIFSVYRPFVTRISEEVFVTFLQDEVRFTSTEREVNHNLTDDQATIIKSFVGIVKSRKTHEYHSGEPLGAKSQSLVGARYRLSFIWNYLPRLNPLHSGENVVRVATLCRLAAEMELPASTEDFIDALFAFFQRKLDQLNFNEFAQLMEIVE
jgi:hypothetical protein